VPFASAAIRRHGWCGGPFPGGVPEVDAELQLVRPKHVESSPENEIMVYSNWDIQAVKKRNGTNWLGKTRANLSKAWRSHDFFSGGFMMSPLVNIQKTMEHHHF